jgi:YegS/Rv2252/BmrU family lipid kinase
VPRKAVLIVNTHSRRGERLFQEARTLLEGAGIHLLAAHAVKDPRRINQQVIDAVRGGAPMVIIGGGDGSLSCTVDHVVGLDCVFALLPLGTANSFARTLGIPLDLPGAVEVIATGRRRRVDLGKINGDYFANCAAMGLSPMISEGVPRGLKRVLGRLAYLLWAAWCLLRFHAFRVTVTTGDKSETLWATEVRIANGSFHGGVELIEEASVASGDIVVQVVTGRSVFPLMWNWLGTVLGLRSRRRPVQTFRGRTFQVATRPRLPVSIDGEVLARTPIAVEVAPRAIEVVVPQENP